MIPINQTHKIEKPHENDHIKKVSETDSSHVDLATVMSHKERGRSPQESRISGRISSCFLIFSIRCHNELKLFSFTTSSYLFTVSERYFDEHKWKRDAISYTISRWIAEKRSENLHFSWTWGFRIRKTYTV